MPSLTTSYYHPPTDYKEFQEMIRDVFAAHWNDPNTQVNGRDGQKQQGVDVYGKPEDSDLWFGIQCKIRNKNKLTRRALEGEINQARAFRHQLHTYIIATTQPRDTKIQHLVETLNEIETSRGGFRVQIRFWEDICSLISQSPKLVEKHFPYIGAVTPTRQKINTGTLSTEITPDSPLDIMPI